MLAEPSHNQISVSFRLAGIAVTSEGTGTNIPFFKLQIPPTADACYTNAKPFRSLPMRCTSRNGSKNTGTKINRKGL